MWEGNIAANFKILSGHLPKRIQEMQNTIRMTDLLPKFWTGDIPKKKQWGYKLQTL